jgi:cephalosporin hydroxylase
VPEKNSGGNKLVIEGNHMDDRMTHEDEVRRNIERQGRDTDLRGLSKIWVREIIPYNYAHNFRHLGRPIIQAPQDIVAVQEIIWEQKPDLIIETGIAHGGSLVLSASMLALLDMADAIEKGAVFDPRQSNRKVVGVDIEIRPHNRLAIETHPMATRIQLVEGSSVAPDIIKQVHEAAAGFKRVMVCLDSNHTHAHVLAELSAYASLVSTNSYCIVFDTGIEDLPAHFYGDRPWGKGNNPKTAVWEFLRTHPEFEVDKGIEQKLLITSAPDGFLKRVR